MRLLRRKRADSALTFDAGVDELARRFHRAIQEAKLRCYADGLADGTIVMLDHLQGFPEAGGEVYTGPVPAELRDYLARTRANVTSSRAAAGR